MRRHGRRAFEQTAVALIVKDERWLTGTQCQFLLETKIARSFEEFFPGGKFICRIGERVDADKCVRVLDHPLQARHADRFLPNVDFEVDVRELVEYFEEVKIDLRRLVAMAQ